MDTKQEAALSDEERQVRRLAARVSRLCFCVCVSCLVGLTVQGQVVAPSDHPAYPTMMAVLGVLFGYILGFLALLWSRGLAMHGIWLVFTPALILLPWKHPWQGIGLLVLYLLLPVAVHLFSTRTVCDGRGGP